MKRAASWILVLSSFALLSACSSNNSSVESSKADDSYESGSTTSVSTDSTSFSTATSEPSSTETTQDQSSFSVATSEPSSTETSQEQSSFSIATSDGSYSKSGSIYTISSYGTYTLSGSLVGQIYVDVPETDEGESEVEIDLNEVDISYGENSPIYIASADKVKIKAIKKTTNTITDLRELESSEDESQGNGAIYGKADLNLIGTGTLNVVGTYNNGVHTTKDLKIKKQNLTVTAPNNAIKGNDSINITSGSITAISTGGDALKTSNSDISTSGKQRGNISITGGTVNLYAACDGIDAAYDAIIAEGVDEDDPDVTTVPEVSIKTNKFSSYTGEIVSSSETTMYLRTTTQHNSSYRYSVYFYNDSLEEGVWRDATYKTYMQGGRNSYYYYELDRPANYSSFKVFKFSSSSSNSLTSYVACSSGDTINTNRDCVTFTSSSNSISISGWTTYSASQGQGGPGGGGNWGGESGNSNKAEDSAKGIKSANSVQISGGNIDIQAHDDGIHANYGETLENGSTGVGDVLISGGSTTIYASDDGVRADRYLRLSGGNVKVSYAYEALEGNQIYISGGTADVFGTDDGVNAGNSSSMAGLSPLLSVSGGYLFCAVPSSGDTDGLDSNANISITGGTVITCGPSSGMASALDADGSVSMSGGTLVVFGGVEKSPSTSLTKSTINGTYGSGNSYTIAFSNGTAINTMAFPNYSYRNGYTWSSNGSLSSIH